MSKNYTPETRQRMRPWLESQINSGGIRGLEWVDKDQKMFKVPWKHVGNREWSEDDGIIFKEWAVHTGRYREGVDHPDWPTWKTRFRCALTKLPDIKELKQYNRLDGNTEEPYRVYQFVPKNGDNSGARFSPRQSDTDSPASEIEYYGGSHIPTTVISNQSDQMMSERFPSDLVIESGDLIKINSSEMRDLQTEVYDAAEPMETMEVPETDEQISYKAKKSYPSQALIMPQNTWTLDPNDCKLYVTVKYLMTTVFENLCTSTSGCHIYHDKQVVITNPEEYEQIFGPRAALQIPLPQCTISNSQQQRLTTDLLNATDRGIVIQVREGNIYATRKCRCRMYISKPTINQGCEIIKLQRDEETLVFDLHGYFRQALERYIHQRGPKPSTDVVVGFGQHFTMERESINNLLVSATIVHTEANNLLTRIACTSPMSPAISLSKSNPLDRVMDICSMVSEQI
ncbi:interferon regulatory factor 4-like isoform X2 [Ruditapes philippinarum]|nr:interferon regulatory factor 4-like isoform X2 [Ruditapes philippinarum]XP_060597201.1 interferon regulatory factor 4-like isoform X2 [Ruditapes philippinarum]XP_060597202.1 interferon regulatory factor 4-like isoform X2 [Ruditapes philippinarum]XP_060597203.1 interferon regulatory factor 4-like isoform X2 [Ruditapes philippinarum]XP_060597205.1 interferon regulatory factor 4-like isoform X2 [Ruditapes philippinarum]